MRLCLLVAVLAVPAVALAQIPRGEQPTPGVYNPTLGVVGDGDASAVEKNPSLMGWLKSWSAVFLFSRPDPVGLVGGGGGGLFVATPLPYLTSLSLGASVQWLHPPDLFPFGDSEKLTLALGWHPVAPIAIGLSYSHLWSNRAPVAAGIDTMDLSLTARARYVGAALVVHDLTAPTVGGLPLQRVWEPELAVRPFGSDVLEIAVAARFGERRQDFDPRFRLWISPTRGLWLKTDVEWRRDVDLDGFPENDIRVAMGLQVDLEHLGASAYGLFGSDEGVTRGHGFSVALRVSGERYPAIWSGPARLEKITLGPGVTERKLAALLSHLRSLERSSSTAGVVVVLGDLDGGWATAEELRAAFLRLRRAKKHVYVYLAETTTRGYYVASAGERIYLDPAGGIRLTGLSSTVMFYKGFGDLIGVRADFVKIGDYKSAPEAYTRTSSSEPAHEMREQLVGDTYGNVVDGIAQARHVPPERVREWIDRGPYTAADALTAGLVDEVRPGDEVEFAIAQRLGRHVAIKDPPTSLERGRSWLKPQIAVVFIEGDITDGKSYEIPILDMKFVGMQSIIPALVKAREDDRIKAVVLRVNSPGGSALASDLIARELERTKAVKPVICSMGDLAASGGYFVSAPCDRIFAAPSTLTGSIGIFTGKFDVTGLAAKLGVSLETYERGKHASEESMYRPYTDEERVQIMAKLRYYYGRFLETVARGRGLTVEQVDAVARGHVWSGRAAQAHGLVDEFGGFTDALAEAKRRAHLSENEPVEIATFPEEQSLLTTVLGWLGIELRAEVAASPVAEVLKLTPGLVQLLRALPGSLLLAPSVPQARLDGHIRID